MFVLGDHGWRSKEFVINASNYIDKKGVNYVLKIMHNENVSGMVLYQCDEDFFVPC